MGIDFYNESINLVKNNHDNDLNPNKLTNLDSITVNRNPTPDNEVATKKYVDTSIREGTIVRITQTLQSHLRVSVGKDFYILTKYDKIQNIDLTEMKAPCLGNDLLQNWKIINIIKNNETKIGKFLKSTIMNSPENFSGGTSLPPIGKSFMYIETSSDSHGTNVFVSFERTDNVQVPNITSYYNRFSSLTDNFLKTVGRFRIQLLVEDNLRSTQYTIPENSQYNNTSSDWSLLNLDFTIETNGIKLIPDQIDTGHSDICFSYITMTHSVY